MRRVPTQCIWQLMQGPRTRSVQKQSAALCDFRMPPVVLGLNTVQRQVLQTSNVAVICMHHQRNAPEMLHNLSLEMKQSIKLLLKWMPLALSRGQSHTPVHQDAQSPILALGLTQHSSSSNLGGVSASLIGESSGRFTRHPSIGSLNSCSLIWHCQQMVFHHELFHVINTLQLSWRWWKESFERRILAKQRAQRAHHSRIGWASMSPHIVCGPKEGLQILQSPHRRPLTDSLTHGRVRTTPFSPHDLSNKFNLPLSELKLLDTKTKTKSSSCIESCRYRHHMVQKVRPHLGVLLAQQNFKLVVVLIRRNLLLMDMTDQVIVLNKVKDSLWRRLLLLILKEGYRQKQIRLLAKVYDLYRAHRPLTTSNDRVRIGALTVRSQAGRKPFFGPAQRFR